MKRKVQCQIVVTTFPDAPQARAFARRVVESRLAACVQVIPVHSVFRWKNKVETVSEFRLEAKTTATQAPHLMSFIRHHHPYELPEIIRFKLPDGSPEYLHWISVESGDPS